MKRNRKKVYKKLVAMGVGTALLMDAPISAFAASKATEEDKDVVQESQNEKVEASEDAAQENTQKSSNEEEGVAVAADTAVTKSVEDNARTNRIIYLGGQGTNGSPVGDGSQQNPFKYIDQACEAAQDGDTIRLVGEAVIVQKQDANKDLEAYQIKKSVTIEGTGVGTLTWYRPIELGADVTFKNITIHMPITGHENNIFAAGYHLTLDNVSTVQRGNRHPYIYGGGFKDHPTGDHAQITIKNANNDTRFAGIYAGTRYKDYNGNVKMDIDERVIIERLGESSVVGEAGIYASGLKGKLAYVDQIFDFNVNGQVDITIRGKNRFGTSITEIQGKTGGTIPKANIEFVNADASNGRLKLYDANNVVVNNSDLKLADITPFIISGDLSLLEKSILDLSNKTTSYVGGDFHGETDASKASILELKDDALLAIDGTVTGSTHFITPPPGLVNINNPISGIVRNDHTYIQSNDVNATGEFLFKSYGTVGEIHKTLRKEQTNGKTSWTTKKEEHTFKNIEISGPKKVTVDDVLQDDYDLAVKFMIKTIDTNDQPFAMDIHAKLLDANGNDFTDIYPGYYSFNTDNLVQTFMLYPEQPTVPTGQYKLQILEGIDPNGKAAPTVLGEYDFEITDTLTGDVALTGNPEVGNTLTANVSNLPQGITDQDVTYQWYVNDVAVPGATSQTWVVAGNANDSVYVEVSHANYANKLKSTPTTITNANQLTGTIQIEGTPRVGETLTANVSNLPQGINEQDLTYQWYVNDVAVQGATSKTWVITANVGENVRVEVSHQNYTVALKSNTITIVDKDPLTGTVNIEGTPRVGETLIANVSNLPQGVSDQDVTYQWYVNNTAVQGATGKTWTVTANIGDTVTVKVSHANYKGELTSTDVTVVDKDPLIGTVSITGTPKVGETLTATLAGLPNDANVTIKWYANNVEVATGTTWTSIYNYVGQEITVKVTADNYAGELVSNPVTLAKQDLVGTVSITGTPKVGETLTATFTGLPNDAANTTIKWYANGVEIATGATWTSTYDYVDQEITVKVTADNYAGELVSGSVTLVRKDITGTVSITGTPQFSETLTASVSQLPADAQNVTYKWYVDGQEVVGVVGNTWKPGKDVVGKAISVKVMADNYVGELTSTEVVLQSKDLPITDLRIEGGSKAYEIVSVDVNNLNLPADAQNISYQWYANGVAIPGATSASWIIGDAYVGQSIYVQLTVDNYTNMLKSNEIMVQPADKKPSISISGNAIIGSTLQVVLQDIPNTVQNISYQWYADGVAIPNATSDSLIVEAAYAGKVITVKVNFEGIGLEVESLKVEIANPENGNISGGNTGNNGTTSDNIPNTGDSTNVFVLLLMAAGAFLTKIGILSKSLKGKDE